MCGTVLGPSFDPLTVLPSNATTPSATPTRRPIHCRKQRSNTFASKTRNTAPNMSCDGVRRLYIGSITPEASLLAHAVRAHWGVESVPQAHGKEVQHELTDCVQATRKMRVGPSRSAFRSGLQTTPSCCG